MNRFVRLFSKDEHKENIQGMGTQLSASYEYIFFERCEPREMGAHRCEPRAALSSRVGSGKRLEVATFFFFPQKISIWVS